MSYYLKDGELFWPTQEGVYDVRDHLPVGTYTVGASPKGFYLKPISEFKIEGKIYGNTPRQADRILNTFKVRENATGVLLNGEKGSGKTMLAKLVSQKAAEQGMPTLVINTAFTGDGFNSFIQSIDEPCIIVFDEFEKVFDEGDQQAILTLLDGVFPSKKLFILTVNNKYRVNEHMRNRPGRIFYMIDYKGLDEQFIREYCEDCLENKTHIDTIARLSMLFESFNFDMLKALVEEMNRYGETPAQALEMLNAKPMHEGNGTMHKVKVLAAGKEIPQGMLHTDSFRGSPVAAERIEICYERPTGKKDDDGDEITRYEDLTITPADLKKIDPEAGTFTYVIKEGSPDMTVVVLTRDRPKYYDWHNAF